jgi:hypothetical protein
MWILAACGVALPNAFAFWMTASERAAVVANPGPPKSTLNVEFVSVSPSPAPYVGPEGSSARSGPCEASGRSKRLSTEFARLQG